MARRREAATCFGQVSSCDGHGGDVVRGQFGEHPGGVRKATAVPELSHPAGLNHVVNQFLVMEHRKGGAVMVGPEAWGERARAALSAACQLKAQHEMHRILGVLLPLRGNR